MTTCPDTLHELIQAIPLLAFFLFTGCGLYMAFKFGMRR